MIQKFGSIPAIIQEIYIEISASKKKREKSGETQLPEEKTTLVKTEVKEEEDSYQNFLVTNEEGIVEVRPVIRCEVKLMKDDRIVEVKE